MKKFIAAAALSVGLAALAAAPAFAALSASVKAPEFVAQASLAGKEFTFKLSESLKKGPVVLYFYPGAFTPGCTIEAYEFGEAMEEFTALGATVVGASGDDIAKLHQFAADNKACNGKFAVAVASPADIKAYDVAGRAETRSNRTSYVIAPDGTIMSTLSSGEPTGHIANALLALKAWRERNPITPAAATK